MLYKGGEGLQGIVLLVCRFRRMVICRNVVPWK